MRTTKYKDLTSLWHGAARDQLLARAEELDFVASADTIRYDNVLACKSMAFDFDAGRDLWLTKSRFTTLQRDYLELPDLERFLARCETIGLGSAKRGVITQMFAKPHTPTDKKYRWGNCMMAWCFRGGERYEKPVLTMHSRVSYIAYIGGLDLALCYVLAREIGERIGCTPEEFKFRWNVDSLQYHFFKSLPYLYRFELDHILEEDDKYPSELHPTLKGIRRWWRDIQRYRNEGKPLDAEKYGPVKRIRRRYEQYKDGDFMAPVPLESLTFDPLRRR